MFLRIQKKEDSYLVWLREEAEYTSKDHSVRGTFRD